MRNRRTILFFLSWSLLFAFAIFVLWRIRQPASVIPRTVLSDIDAGMVSKVEIDRSLKNGKSERIVLARSAGRWRIESPIVAEADEEAVKRLVDSVVFAEPKDTLSLHDMKGLRHSVRDYGLVPPDVFVTIVSGSRSDSYSFGRQTASGDEVYVMQTGDGPVLTVPTKTLHELKRPFVDFRRRRLFSFFADDISGIGLKNANEPFSKIARAGGAWRISEPIDAPADRKVADALVEAVCSARILSYAAAGEGLGAGLGDDEGGYVLSLRNSLGAIERAVIGTAAGSNVVWALTPEGATVRIGAQLLEECRKCQKTLEDTRVFPVEPTDVTSISISISKSFPAYILSRGTASDPWLLESPVDAPADAALAGRLLAKLLSVRSADILPDATNDVKAFDVFVRTAMTNFPTCTIAQDYLVKGMRLPDLRDRLLIRQPIAKVRKVNVCTSAGAKWELRPPKLASQGEKPHELFKCLEEGVSAERVEMVALKNEDFQRYGFDKPSYTITFELDDKKSAMKTLLIGTAAPGGGRYANIGGSDAAFVLSAATISSLTKPAE